MKKQLYVALCMLACVEVSQGMSVIREWQTNKVYNPPSVTNSVPVVTNAAPVPPPEPPVVVPAPTHPFVGKRIVMHRIAKNILSWKETAHISKASWKGNTLTTSGTFPKWPCKDGLQGNFGLAVEQPDGSIVIGTWDWDRCPHQTVKSAGNNLSSTGEHAFFNLRPGCRIWWFTAGLCRDNKRNVEERSDFYPDTWK